MDRLGPRLGSTRSLLHLAAVDDADHSVANVAEPHTTRPDASQIDVDHALGLQRDVLFLPCGLGVVLVDQQHFVDRPAMDDQQTNGRFELTQTPFFTGR